MNKKKETTINRVKTALFQIDEEASIFLFGSRAMNAANEDSDWDFLFLTSSPVTISLRKKIVKKMLPIELSENILIQVIPKNKMEWEAKYAVTPLYKNIKREGIAL